MENQNYAKGLLLGENATEFTWLILNDNDVTVFTNKDYFNKYTEEIYIYKCKLGNELVEIIDDSKEVLLIKVSYTIDYFGNGRRHRIKNYIYINNIIYQHNKNIKRVPKEIKLVLKDYFKINEKNKI